MMGFLDSRQPKGACHEQKRSSPISRGLRTWGALQHWAGRRAAIGVGGNCQWRRNWRLCLTPWPLRASLRTSGTIRGGVRDGMAGRNHGAVRRDRPADFFNGDWPISRNLFSKISRRPRADEEGGDHLLCGRAEVDSIQRLQHVTAGDRRAHIPQTRLCNCRHFE